MYHMSRSRAVFFILLVLLTGPAACTASLPSMSEMDPEEPEDRRSFRAYRDVDILFLVDNSGSMEHEQEKLAARFTRLADILECLPGGLPHLHIGVVTSDLGTSPYRVDGCGSDGGNDGVLGVTTDENGQKIDLGATHLGPGQRYIVDVEPTGCRIPRNDEGFCASHECGDVHCEAVRHGSELLTLYDDKKGCPRCRNYEGALFEVFSRYARTGTHGCGFEQPLEAIRKALDATATPQNAGFLRDWSLLAVVILTDEDDCSASRPDILFNNDRFQNDMSSLLGPIDSFRCFEFGIICDTNGRAQGPRTGCRPRDEEDPSGFLHPVSRYTAFLEGIKDPSEIIVAAIAGPVPDIIQVEHVVSDGRTIAALAPSCWSNPFGGAAAGIRIRELTHRFNSSSEMNDWAFQSICSEDYSRTLSRVGMKIATMLPP